MDIKEIKWKFYTNYAHVMRRNMYAQDIRPFICIVCKIEFFGLLDLLVNKAKINPLPLTWKWKKMLCNYQMYRNEKLTEFFFLERRFFGNLILRGATAFLPFDLFLDPDFDSSSSSSDSSSSASRR